MTKTVLLLENLTTLLNVIAIQRYMDDTDAIAVFNLVRVQPHWLYVLIENAQCYTRESPVDSDETHGDLVGSTVEFNMKPTTSEYE